MVSGACVCTHTRMWPEIQPQTVMESSSPSCFQVSLWWGVGRVEKDLGLGQAASQGSARGPGLGLRMGQSHGPLIQGQGQLLHTIPGRAAWGRHVAPRCLCRAGADVSCPLPTWKQWEAQLFTTTAAAAGQSGGTSPWQPSQHRASGRAAGWGAPSLQQAACIHTHPLPRAPPQPCPPVKIEVRAYASR